METINISKQNIALVHEYQPNLCKVPTVYSESYIIVSENKNHSHLPYITFIENELIFGDENLKFYSCDSKVTEQTQQANQIAKFSKNETKALEVFEGADGYLIFIEENPNLSPLEIYKEGDNIRFNLSLTPEKLESVHQYFHELSNKLFCVANTNEALHSLVVNMETLEIEDHFQEPVKEDKDLIYIGCFYLDQKLVTIDSWCQIISYGEIIDTIDFGKLKTDFNL